MHHEFGRAVHFKEAPVFFRTVGIVWIAFPGFIKRLEKEHGYIRRLRPCLKLIVIAQLVCLIGLVWKLHGSRSPPGFENSDWLVWQRRVYVFDVFDRE